MRRTIPFAGTITASTADNLISGSIGQAYEIEELIFHFTLGSDFKLQLSVYVCGAPADPGAGTPVGTNVIGTLGQVTYVVGDESVIHLKCGIKVEESPTWLMLYCNNTDGSNHAVFAAVVINTIEPAAEPPAEKPSEEEEV